MTSLPLPAGYNGMNSILDTITSLKDIGIPHIFKKEFYETYWYAIKKTKEMLMVCKLVSKSLHLEMDGYETERKRGLLDATLEALSDLEYLLHTTKPSFNPFWMYLKKLLNKVKHQLTKIIDTLNRDAFPHHIKTSTDWEEFEAMNLDKSPEELYNW